MPFDCVATREPPTRLQSGRILPDDAHRLTLEERIENWAGVWRWRMRLAEAGSFEGCYRSPQYGHWDDVLGSAPSVTPSVSDKADAREVELAAAALDIYHHVILKGNYVRRWSAHKCLQVARKAAGDERTRRRGDFAAALLMAKALLGAQLNLPAVVRRARAVERVRTALGFPVDGIGERPQ